MKLLLLLMLIGGGAYGQDIQNNTEKYTIQIGKKSISNVLEQLNTILKNTNLNTQAEQLFLYFAEQNKLLPMIFSGFDIPKNTKQSFIIITNPDKENRYQLPSNIFSKTMINTDDFLVEQEKLLFFILQKTQNNSLISLEYIDYANNSQRFSLNKKESDVFIKLTWLSQQSKEEALQFLFAEYMKYMLQKM